MGNNQVIRKLQVKNLLSFGNAGIELELGPLNVLIGPNGSGKSNLLEVLSVVQATPADISQPIRQGGGMSEWLWKGNSTPSPAMIGAVLAFPESAQLLDYQLDFELAGSRLRLVDEVVKEKQQNKNGQSYHCYQYRQGQPIVNTRKDYRGPISEKHSRVQEDWAQFGQQLNAGQSILSQVISPQAYPELTFIGQQFRQIQLYRGFDLARAGSIRRPQRTDLPGDHLLEDGSNLWLVINSLDFFHAAKPRILELCKRFYEPTSDFKMLVQGGTMQFFLHEQGLTSPVSAMQLSDGTLRYLCLLAILLDPTPPSLICIEEPETGLHPDILPIIAELLIEASQRTQLIVTTHSETLISALGDYPEAVIVCERGEQGTTLQRLDRERLQKWLADYSLGMLWSMGEIGGTR